MYNNNIVLSGTFVGSIKKFLNNFKNKIRYEIKENKGKITYLKLIYRDKQHFRIVVEFEDYTPETLLERIKHAIKNSFGIELDNKKKEVIKIDLKKNEKRKYQFKQDIKRISL